MGSKSQQHDDRARASSAGTSSSGGGDGGRDGDGKAAPPAPPGLPLAPPPTSSPSRDPRAAATSPPPLQPPRAPPRAADQNTDGVPDNGDLREEENDVIVDEDEVPDDDYMPAQEDDGGWSWEQEEAEYNFRHLEDDADSEVLQEGEVGDDQDRGENHRGPADSKFFSILFMSDRRSVPDDIIRNGLVPLNKHKYFSLHQFWSQLLGRNRSYHRPRKDHRVVNGGFRCPVDHPIALGIQEPLSELICESSNNYTIQEKIKILSKQYGFFRRTRNDGSCFYRALLFSYLENLGQMQDRQAEVIRLMECVEVSIKGFYQLEWEEAYFLNPKEYFLSVVYEFYCLVNSVANGLTSEKLYERSLEETSSGRIISFLRLLTEIEIRTKDIYAPYIPERMTAFQFCWKEVRNLYAEAGSVPIRALTYALGIPLRVEIADRKTKKGQAVQVRRLDFFRQSDLGKGPLQLVRSFHSSSTAHKPLEQGRDDSLLSSDGAPLVTLLSRSGRCDVLYRK